MVIFSLSPPGTIYQHEVLVDNIGTFWLLLSLYLMVVSESHLSSQCYMMDCFMMLGIK